MASTRARRTRRRSAGWRTRSDSTSRACPRDRCCSRSGADSVIRVQIQRPDGADSDEEAAEPGGRVGPPARAAARRHDGAELVPSFPTSVHSSPFRRAPRHVPRSLSFTALALHERCPYRYLVERELGLAPVSRAGAGDGSLGALDVGRAVHAMLEGGSRLRSRRVCSASRCGDEDRARIEAFTSTFEQSALAAEVAASGGALHEQPFAFAVDGVVFRGVLDVLVRRADGSMLVIDYKTTRLGDRSPDELVAEEYELQRQAYALALLRGGATSVDVAFAFLERADTVSRAVVRARGRAHADRGRRGRDRAVARVGLRATPLAARVWGLRRPRPDLRRTATRMSGAITDDAERRRMSVVLRRLRKAYPEAGIALHFGSPWELLVATMLSAQCTDERVNQVTPGLFARYPDVEAFAAASQEELARRSTPPATTTRRRARCAGAAHAARRALRRRGAAAGSASSSKLPGVGRKTAAVVLGNAFGLAPGHRRRHARRAHRPPARLHLRDRPGEGRAAPARAGAASVVDAVHASADRTRPRRLPVAHARAVDGCVLLSLCPEGSAARRR